ncbi:hypothetical protein [Fusibacillus kribbianus]|uniref:Uncharacterized protein n=1 Tax=Fusibacillus kribbianus TaxID=3044208 RepID=A0AAP4B9G6_9FIRM|nr:hypothetical protein [Ruminococcus sp. YH-rum2234]MDI9241148.1 hypothetical protein [Ruminococcus sp. YH-rum2234]
MTDRELKKLGRAELLELLLEQSKENERLRAQVSQLEAQLADREINVEKAGSIAEASLQLNGVFQAAENACAQYIENIKRLSDRQEEVCARMERETRLRCAQMVDDAKQQSKLYWDAVSRKTQELSDSYRGLQKILEQVPEPMLQK